MELDGKWIYITWITFTGFLEVYLVCFHCWAGISCLPSRLLLLSFQQMLNMLDGVVEDRRGTLGKRSPEIEWVRIRSAILNALERYPDAMEEVVQALLELRAIDEGGGR